MKIKPLFTLILLIVLVLSGCSHKEITPHKSKETPTPMDETVIADTPISPTIEKKSESKAEILTPTDTEKKTPSTEVPHTETVSQTTTTTISNNKTIIETAPKTVPPSVTEPPKKEVKETESEEIPQATKPTIDIDFFITYAKDLAKNIGLKYDNTATDCWDNPITANTNTWRVTADIESRLNRYKNVDSFDYICIWYEKVAENMFEIYIGYA